jgi:hypothetical protein
MLRMQSRYAFFTTMVTAVSQNAWGIAWNSFEERQGIVQLSSQTRQAIDLSGIWGRVVQQSSAACVKLLHSAKLRT